MYKNEKNSNFYHRLSARLPSSRLLAIYAMLSLSFLMALLQPSIHPIHAKAHSMANVRFSTVVPTRLAMVASALVRK